MYRALRPLLFQFDPETAHGLALKALRAGLIPPQKAPSLPVKLWDLTFPNPVGLAAGFDKNASALAPLSRLGFGFIEAGTVTPLSQAGNPRPRVFRDAKTESVINAMGFPCEGLDVFKRNLEAYRARAPKPSIPIGVNIGMNKGQADPASDYRQLIAALGSLADYFTVNISSPNTPGLRNLQARENLLPLLAAILDERAKLSGRQPPVLVKLSPDINEAEQDSVADALLASRIDGIVLTNTTLARPDTLPSAFAARTGGLSGIPVRERATQTIRAFHKMTGGKLPIIGVGGISSAADAREKLNAGASLVQLYTGFIFEGPGVVREITRGLI